MEYQKALEVFERHLHRFEINGKPDELYMPIKYTLEMGGKRIRPVLLLMAGSLFTNNCQKMLDAALGLEMFHNFTLVHDDIMDNAPLRRGKETVHQKWNRDIAILSGDVMFVRASQLVSSGSGLYLKEILDLFYSSAILVCEGQQMDMNFESEGDVSIADYLEMIEKKTAVLIACSMQMGAIMGGAKLEDARHLYEFGRHIGIAFQLQDDILDAFAKDERFGKRIGGDIISDKKTFLLLKAMELADEKTSAEIAEAMQTSSSGEKVEKMLQIFEKLDIKNIAEQKMQQYFNMGMECLEKVDVSDNEKLPLRDLAQTLMHRNS